MLYTKKGDGGTTTTFGCDQRMSKSSAIAEALGTLDECNSFLGVIRAESAHTDFKVGSRKVTDILFSIQNTIFTVQAEIAGAGKMVASKKVNELESLVADIENELPEIKNFFIPGTTKFSAKLDFARTLVRRAERRVAGVHDEGVQEVGKYTLAYMNRLSSLLYALTRLANQQDGIREDSPSYQ